MPVGQPVVVVVEPSPVEVQLVDLGPSHPPPALPTGGAVNEPLVKVSTEDNDVRWGGAVTVPGVLTANGTINANAGVIMGAGDRVQFQNEEGDKVYLYPGATPGGTSFGLGIAASTMVLFVPNDANFRFRDGGGHDSGEEWFLINNNGAYFKSTKVSLEGHTHPAAGSGPDNIAHLTVVNCGIREGMDFITYNEAFVAWNLVITSVNTGEGNWINCVNAGGVPANLRPPVNMEKWSAMPDSTGNATGVGIGMVIRTDGSAAWYKPSDGPDIKSGCLISFDFCYPYVR